MTRNATRITAGLGVLIGGVVFAATMGCAASTGPYQPAAEARRDPAKAQRLTARAADLITEDPEKAETLLREALAADLYHGPAHNNLGVIFMNRGQLYEAANEFEWGRKLMPGHPDPRFNLAMTLEQAGRVDDAIDAYRAALEVYPGHLPSVMGLTRAEVRSGMANEQTAERLRDIVLRAEDTKWRAWAERELIRMPN